MTDVDNKFDASDERTREVPVIDIGEFRRRSTVEHSRQLHEVGCQYNFVPDALDELQDEYLVLVESLGPVDDLVAHLETMGGTRAEIACVLLVAAAACVQMSDEDPESARIIAAGTARVCEAIERFLP